jgi:hypothetical protein
VELAAQLEFKEDKDLAVRKVQLDQVELVALKEQDLAVRAARQVHYLVQVAQVVLTET